MKSSVEVNRDWQSWVNETAKQNDLSANQRLSLIASVTPEVRWYDHTRPTEETVVMRIAKMKSMSDTAIKTSEPMWDYKIQFLQWLCV